MLLSDVISVAHRNVRSVNVERELRSASPLGGFVPTEQVLDGVRRFLAALRDEPVTRAWSITGPYGAGKSSFAHFICALFADTDTAVYREAYQLLDQADGELASRLETARSQLGIVPLGANRAVATAEREPIAATVARALHRGAETFWAARRGRRPRVLDQLRSAT